MYNQSAGSHRKNIQDVPGNTRVLPGVPATPAPVGALQPAPGDHQQVHEPLSDRVRCHQAVRDRDRPDDGELRQGPRQQVHRLVLQEADRDRCQEDVPVPYRQGGRKRQEDLWPRHEAAS